MILRSSWVLYNVLRVDLFEKLHEDKNISKNFAIF